MKLISVSDPNVWRSVEESGICFWGCCGFKPEIMRRGKGQDQSWKGRIQSEKWKANINKTTSDLRDGLTISSDPYPHGRRSNFFPPKKLDAIIWYPISAPSKIRIGRVHSSAMRPFWRRWAPVAPVLSVALGILRTMAFSLPTPSSLLRHAASTEADYDCWEKARLDPDVDPEAGQAINDFRRFLPGVYPGSPENMVVFLQKWISRGQWCGNPILNFARHCGNHAHPCQYVFFMAFGLPIAFREVTILFQSNIEQYMWWSQLTFWG